MKLSRSRSGLGGSRRATRFGRQTASERMKPPTELIHSYRTAAFQPETAAALPGAGGERVLIPHLWKRAAQRLRQNPTRHPNPFRPPKRLLRSQPTQPPNPQPPAPNSPPCPSRYGFPSLRASSSGSTRRWLRSLWPTRKLRMCTRLLRCAVCSRQGRGPDLGGGA